MRRGRVVGTTTPAEVDEHQLAAMMVGRDVLLEVDKEPAEPGDEVLIVQELHARDDRLLETLRGVSFAVCAGEVLGIAGVQGNGQTELAEVLTGLRGAMTGTIYLGGAPIPFQDPRYLVENGMAHIPEDRQKHGLVLSYSVADNLVLNTYYQEPFAEGIRRRSGPILERAAELIKKYDVRTPGPQAIVSHLSGGNQQKVIVARELSRPVQLLIANQPTRGLDVGSIEFIHRRIVEERDRGVAVLLISAELDEILALSDRIAVMFHGQIVATMPADQATREKLGVLMAGGTLAA
jgi:simple sugar transport system ATP-binding protein